MSPIGPTESFQRLEEFPSFVSSIKCFGRPIIPPLLTPSRKCELQQIRTAATNIEAKIFKRRKDLQDKKNSQMLSNTDTYSNFPSNEQESCALWYPSSKDYQDGISVAISKLPSSGIYSSVHTGAIVCSDVIENSHRYASIISRDSSYNPEIRATGCIECSHNNMNLDCRLCQAEYDQNSFHNCSFGSEVSPEVPCRSFSLEQNASLADDDHKSTMEETECESLPTVICSQKYVAADTDSESNITCMTQSTDLDKYMELSCEFGSPDNSAETWDSKSTSQQFTLSRSDDASSETMVNTENELTPCASTLAEFTDNIEDELSNADEAAGSENKELTSGTLRRAHSIDSYMKIIQTCARSMHVKKSASEPFNTNSELFSSLSDEIKTSNISKTSHLIKEDSKESEESKELPEKDIYNDAISESVSSLNDKNSVSNAEKNSFQKKHVRRNSYTLDQPSSALILAHADCSCNLDTKCISPPHCSALKEQEDQRTSFAFIKEKVEIDIPVSVQEKYPVLNYDVLVEDASVEGLTLPVVNVFPTVKEDGYEKSNLENSNSVEEMSDYENISTLQSNSDVKLDTNEKSPNNLSICDSNPSEEYIKKIFQELQENRKIRVKEFYEERNRQWMKLHEEFKQQEKILREKLKQTIASPNSTSNQNSDFNEADHNHKEVSSDSISIYREDKTLATDPVIAASKETHSFDSICAENDKPEHLNRNSESHSCSCLICNPPKNDNENIDSNYVFTAPSESLTCNNNSSASISNTKHLLKNQDSKNPVTCSYQSDISHCACVSDSLQSRNAFTLQSAVLLPQYDSQSFSNSLDVKDVSSTCFCKESPKEYSYSAAVNGYKEDIVNHCYPEYNIFYSDNSLPDHIEPHCQNSSSSFISSQDLNLYDVSSAYNTDNLQKTSDIPSKKSNPTLMRKSNSISSQDDLHFLNTVHSNRDKSSSQSSLRDKNKLPVDNIISLCVKSLRNGSVPSFDVTPNKQIVIDSAILERFKKLPAFVKGYLTRRLFKTERVQSLIKTLQDTALLIGKLSEDLSLKGDAVSERDVDFHRQLIVQLMTTFHNVYDIFCTISTKERMNIITESRNFKLKQEPVATVISKAPVPEPYKKHKLSSATLKALERKRRSRSNIDSRTYTLEDFRAFRTKSAIENRTYTIDQLKSRPGRPRSHTLSKSHSVSPSSVYKVSIGLSPKRKTASSKTSKSHPCVHLKWVP